MLNSNLSDNSAQTLWAIMAIISKSFTQHRMPADNCFWQAFSAPQHHTESRLCGM
jgi:hypothetical protein